MKAEGAEIVNEPLAVFPLNGSSRKFFVYREGETSNIATCRHVAEGIIFSSNKVAVNWLTGRWPVMVYDNVDDARRDLCRDGKTDFMLAEMPG
jgi:hypothetical protein